MEVTKRELAARFEEKADDELFDLEESDTLTTLAKEALQEEIDRRGLTSRPVFEEEAVERKVKNSLNKRNESLKFIGSVRTIASYLFMLGVVTLILTVVQPMNPEVDKMFRIGAGIVMVVCLGLLFALPQPPDDEKSDDSTPPET